MGIVLKINGEELANGFLIAPSGAGSFPVAFSVSSPDGDTGQVQLRVGGSGGGARVSPSTVEIGGAPASLVATSQSAQQDDIVVEAEKNGAVLASIVLTAISNPRARFAGRFQARIATDRDYYNHPRGTSQGWTWALEGEPDFVPAANSVPTGRDMGVGRTIRFHDPVALRSHALPIGVFVTAVEGETQTASVAFTSGDAIIGLPVGLGPSAYFSCNSPKNPADPAPFETWAPGEEPIEGFVLSIGSAFSGRSKALTDRPRAIGFDPLTPEEIAAYGIVPRATFESRRKAMLLTDYLDLTPADRTGTAAGRNLSVRIGHLGGESSLGIPRLGSTLSLGWSGQETYRGLVNDAVSIMRGASPVLAYFSGFADFSFEGKFFNFHSDELCGRVDASLTPRTPQQIARLDADAVRLGSFARPTAATAGISSQKIVALMQVPVHDVAWIKEAAQAAVELELATIPPYLCALWSIDEIGTEAEEIIRQVLLDEMGHMGLMCNLLRGLGIAPKITSSAPMYPGSLPGGVRPELTVYLSGLSRNSLHGVLMAIEKPEAPLAVAALVETFPSIGNFYRAIANALVQKSPPLTTAGQLRNGQVGLAVLSTVQEAVAALERIMGQGEGTSSSADFGGSRAHYYAFAEIYHGRKLVEDPPGRFTYSGTEVPFPKCLPMSPVPAGGWPNRDPDGRGTLAAFNALYLDVLKKLEGAWDGGGATDLSRAIGLMLTMEEPARLLMSTPRSPCDGNYGPDFLI